MTPDEPRAVHVAALAAVRDVARATAAGITPADLPQVIADAAGRVSAVVGTDAGAVGAMATAYLFAARVGGEAADPGRAVVWVTGWSRARARTPDEVHLAAVDGVRFGERLHRALGLDDPRPAAGDPAPPAVS